MYVYIRYLISLLQLFKTLTKALMKDFFLQQSFRLFQSPLSEADPAILPPMALQKQFTAVRFESGC